MKQKKIPMRTCTVSHERFPKSELVRIVRTPEGEVKIDLSGKMNGRGAYLKKDLDIIKKAQQTKTLEKHLDIKISDEVYNELCDMLEK